MSVSPTSEGESEAETIVIVQYRVKPCATAVTDETNYAAVTRDRTMVLSLSLIYFCHFEIYHFTRVN